MQLFPCGIKTVAEGCPSPFSHTGRLTFGADADSDSVSCQEVLGASVVDVLSAVDFQRLERPEDLQPSRVNGVLYCLGGFATGYFSCIPSV